MSTNKMSLEGFKDLYCPILLIPMKNAYSLVPCMHKVSMEALEGIRQANVPNSYKCPICRTISPAHPDAWTSNVVKTILGIGNTELIPKVCAIVVEEERIGLTYPGKGAKFELGEKDWQLDRHLVAKGIPLVRQLTLKSATEGSFLREINVFGYRTGKVKLSADFLLLETSDSHREIIENYFSSHNISLKEIPDSKWKPGNGCSIKLTLNPTTKTELESLFTVVAKNNEIPEEWFPLLQDLVKNGDWTKVTPLKETESLEKSGLALSSSSAPEIGGYYF